MTTTAARMNEEARIAGAATAGKPDFQKPGPGSWEFDAMHFSKPAFGPVADVFPPAFVAGMRACMKQYGMLLETFDVRFVNGFPYMQAKIVGVPAGDGKPPPPFLFKLIFKALVALHPEVRRRVASQRDLFERRPWLDTLKRWDASMKAETIARHAAVDAIDPASLDDRALGAHVRRVREYAIATLTQDHSMNLDVMLPIGDFLVHVSAWTGKATPELLHLLKGRSDVSAGDSVERRAVVAALRSDDVARALLESGRPAREIYDELVARSGAVGEAMRAMQVVWGNSILHGIDPATPTVREQPGAMLEALRRCVRGEAARPSGDDAARAVRAVVPEQHRALFDVLLDDARSTYRLRDERHLYGALPCLGIGRRVYLEAGRRLSARGALADERHGALADERLVFMATGEELAVLLIDDDRGVVPHLLARQVLADTLRGDDAPAVLGPPIEPPPPPEWLPNEGARRTMRALSACMEALEGGEQKDAAASVVEGLAVSRGVHEGIARVCRTPSDLERIRQGDVLVAACTTPAINVVLPVLGAIVTDRGGALSHAAIVCREYGIPGVVGTRTATRLIKDGARLRVDGDRGIVTLL